MNKTLVKILAQMGYMFLSQKAVRTNICTWLHNRFLATLGAVGTLVGADFPTTSIEERMVKGPIVTFLQKIAGPTVVDLDNTVTAQYQELLNLCDRLRKS